MKMWKTCLPSCLLSKTAEPKVSQCADDAQKNGTSKSLHIPDAAHESDGETRKLDTEAPTQATDIDVQCGQSSEAASVPPPSLAEQQQQQQSPSPLLQQQQQDHADVSNKESSTHRRVRFEGTVTTHSTKFSNEGVENDCLSIRLLQQNLPQELRQAYSTLTTKAAGLRHIGFGPLKKENQDEYFVQVGAFAEQPNGCCYCIFDGHGTYGGDVANFCRVELPQLLQQHMANFYKQAASMDPEAFRSGVAGMISQVFVGTERRLHKSGVNVASSGTTASVVYQDAHMLWVASAGDSRVITIQWHDGEWVAQPLTLDHRPSRRSEKKRVEAAGGRVEPKRLPSGRMVGEPRLWLQDVPSPGLLLSRSIGDGMASSVGCTSEPEITFLTLQPHVDGYLVICSDGVWDVLDNDQVCQLVSQAEDPSLACQSILEASLLEWEERLAADNISVIVAKFDWD